MKSFDRITRISRSQRSAKQRQLRRRATSAVFQAAFEPLETRRLMTLLGVNVTTPDFLYFDTGSVHYTRPAILPGVGTMDVTAANLTFSPDSLTTYPVIITGQGVSIHALINSADGSLAAGGVGSSLSVTGGIDLDRDGSIDHGETTGILISGQISGFGFQNVTTTDLFDFRVTNPVGMLSSEFGSTVGITLSSENSTFTGSFASNFQGNSKGNIGAIRRAIGDYVWEDSNENGVQESGETGINGVTVKLLDSTGSTVLATTVTSHNSISNTDGYYLFDNIAVGSYKLQFVKPSGYEFSPALQGGDTTRDSNPDTVTGLAPVVLTSSSPSTDLTFDAGLFRPVQIGNFVWNDVNGDGLQDADEPGIDDVTLTLTGTTGAGVSVVDHAVTADNGAYLFTEAPGTYSVSVDADNFTGLGVLAGTTASPTLVGPDRTVDSNPNPTGTTPAQLASNGSDLTLDFGYYVAPQIHFPSSLSGYVYYDSNNDGSRVLGSGFEAPIANVTVILTGTDDAGPVNITTTTNGAGFYSFTGLDAGTYTITEIQPSAYLDGKDTIGTPGGVTTNDQFSTIVLAEGVDGTDNNFGELLPSSLSGYVYYDSNNDGSRSGEAPIANTTVTLSGTDDLGVAVSTSTTSNGSGFYSFTNLRPGSYVIDETQPAGYLDGKDTIGTPGGTTSNDEFSDIALNAGVDGTENNFGELLAATISGIKYKDLTANGITADDTPLGGVTINLFQDADNNGVADGAAVASTTTAGTGAYSFGGLLPGNYLVQEVVPAGFVNTTPTSVDVPLSSGDTAPADFANAKLANISGIKYNDLTANGITGDDTPLGGVTINLFLDADNNGVADGAAIGTTTTTDSSTGAYSFTGLLPGNYLVQEVVPAGYANTTSTAIDVALSGNDVSGINFANAKLANISGIKYKDLTANGITADDTPLAGVTINLFLDADNNGVADGNAIASTVTAAGTGAYSFGGLLPGNYLVQEVVPAGYANTATTSIDVALSGTNVSGINFANAKLANISGIKYKDLTANGITADDTPMGGVIINLFKDSNGDNKLTAADGAPVATTTTASGTGAYSFNGLLPGTYFVQEVVPTGYQQTAPNPSTYVVNLCGADVTGENFANAKLASISGIKYLDLTGNGITADDTPFGGVTIQLFKDNGDGVLTSADGAAIATTTTAAGTGAYSFGNLLPGTYFVQEVVPTGYQQTAPTGNGIYTVALSGVDITGRNFANKLVLGSISGNKYLDLTGNGLTADDTGLGGVQIKLYRDVNNDGVLTSADGAAIATATSAPVTGAYSFTGLAAGNYFVQEITPSGYVRTAPTLTDKYYVAVASGANVTGKNFANAIIHDCKDDITCVSYKVAGCNIYSDLLGHTHEQDTVTVTFTVKPGQTDQFTLVSYKAPSPVFIASEADEQTIFDVDTGTFGPGVHTLTVTIPDSYYQIDFVCGTAIDHLGPDGSNIFYSAQGRLISHDNAGSNSDIDGLSKGPKYWASASGQTLIKGLNGGSSSTLLATWMANSFPRLYGSQAGSYNLTGKTNAQVAANISSLYNGGSTKLATADAMAVAISMWVSTISQGGNTAAILAAGFRPTSGGLAPAIFNVLSDGAAFDVTNNSNHTVLDLMKDSNNNAINGLLYSSDSTLRSEAVDILSDICDYGDIDVV